MRLDEHMDIERDERAGRRRLAKEKPHDILDRLETFQNQLGEMVQGGSLYGGVSPSTFVGRLNYPNISTGILSSVGHDEDAASFETSAAWYDEGVSVDDVFQRYTSPLSLNRGTKVMNVVDSWDGLLGTQREVAVADRPMTVEIGLNGRPSFDLDTNADDVATPVDACAHIRSAGLAKNLHVPRLMRKTLEDDDWNAEGTMTYFYCRGFNMYDINTILSAGALSQTGQHRLVSTWWSTIAVDDTLGQYLRGQVKHAENVNGVEIHRNEFIGNTFWVILASGRWEFELIELKAPGSVWNPDPEAGIHLAADREGYKGRTGYVNETTGVHHASHPDIPEHLQERGRQAEALVIRHVSNDYWGPVGVWQIREPIRHAFEGEIADTKVFGDVVRNVTEYLPMLLADLRRKSTMAMGPQTGIFDFA